MKIDRLMGILTVLLQKEKVTAPYLAERFEVSRRTINRDIEDLCKAGIPISTLPGAAGGIMITEGYQIDKTLFTQAELKSIFTGLMSLSSISPNEKYRSLIDKIFPKKLAAGSHMKIDLTSFYKATIGPKIEALQKAVEEQRTVEFNYCNARGERHVVLDPYLITFQWANWYIFGFEHDSEKFKLYKLNRLSSLHTATKSFALRDIPDGKIDFNQHFTDDIKVTAIFDVEMKYRLLETYGESCYTQLPDGRLKFTFAFTNKDYLFEWLLSFGDKVELIEPVELRKELKNILEKTLKKYRNDDI